MALFRPSSPEYLDDGTVVCSGHLRVICDICCTDYSPLDESPGDDSDPFAHSADEEQDEDGENSEDDDTESFDIPRPSYRFRNRVRRGEGKVIAEKFIPPSDFAAAAKPQELFPPALGINSIPVVRRFINRRDATQVLVFTDGACLNNGGTNPQAGCAFFFRPAQNAGEKEKGQRFVGVTSAYTSCLITSSAEKKATFRINLPTPRAMYHFTLKRKAHLATLVRKPAIAPS
jgi:hypothetical protein